MCFSALSFFNFFLMIHYVSLFYFFFIFVFCTKLLFKIKYNCVCNAFLCMAFQILCHEIYFKFELHHVEMCKLLFLLNWIVFKVHKKREKILHHSQFAMDKSISIGERQCYLRANRICHSKSEYCRISSSKRFKCAI